MSGPGRGHGPDAAQQAEAVAARKADHLRVALAEDVAHVGVTTGLERYRLAARALPGRDLDAVSLAATALGRDLAAPLLISCMTGGTSEAGSVNRALAAAAQAHRVALGLGSGRVLLAGGDPQSFRVRDVAPDVLLLANLGAVQLPALGVEACRELVGATGADALVLHLNAVQEAVQPGGDTGFGGLLDHIADAVAGLEVPVVVKEVGFGLGPADLRELRAAGVTAVDVAGAGGTNWATVEGHRDPAAGAVAAAFASWGWPTAESLAAAVEVGFDLVVGSGGLRDGVDAAKVLALGADLAGFGRRVLAGGAAGPAAAVEALGVLVAQLRIAVWACGAPSVSALDRSHLVGGG